jgi:tetratricopeptide (TPR) repeat protein
MPYGSKPLGDGTGRVYDFEKVYRVIMRRAIKLAGMEAIRADERKGSNIIHTEMFKDLRDHAVVLADLSLHNPNVFYELGIRHVMSPTGTVLVCRDGSDLPFDVKLSRVIFYKYDGANLDWEEAERIVKELAEALEEARRGRLDSPVHTLLQHVLADPDSQSAARTDFATEVAEQREPLDLYQKLVAELWAQQGKDLAELKPQHAGAVFGSRALGYYCLGKDPIPAEAREVARSLYYVEQYDLANEIYRRLDQSDPGLAVPELLNYGSSLSESAHTVSAAEKGIDYQNRALQLVEARLRQDPDDLQALEDLARAHHMLSGLYLWKWELTGQPLDLEKAIIMLETAVDNCERATGRVDGFPVGRLAQTRLKLMLALRLRDQDRDRRDVEHHREAILKLKPKAAQSVQTTSYLRWYQAITLADAGDAQGSHNKVLYACLEDAKVMNRPDASDVGRRQYSSLRRLLEQYSHVWQHPSLVGHIAQVLQIGHRSRSDLMADNVG